jgi:hypothetical protein
MTSSFSRLIPLILVGAGCVFSQSTATWQQLNPATSPPARRSAGLAYDSARHQVVLFGGIGQSEGLTDTWTWDGTNWTQKFPANNPPSDLFFFVMAYDSARQETVWFATGTWVWDGNNWTQKFPANSPSARYASAAAYDVARQQIVLFGGVANGTVVNDTWVWDGNNWTQKFPANSPSARSFSAMAYDAARQQTVLFGGYLANGTVVNDTWVWDGNNWTQKFPANSPAGGEASAAAYDVALGEIVLFGGYSGFDFLNTWTWDGTKWTQQMPTNQPSPRRLANMTYDALHQQVLLFGGYALNQATYLEYNVSETWVYPARFNPQLTCNATPNPSMFGQPVTLTATVNPLATGTITFYTGVTILGTLPVVGGMASITTITLPAGNDPIRAHYSGDSIYPTASLTVSATVTTVPASRWIPSTGSPLALGPGPFAAVAADFNGDNKVDLAVVNAAAGNVTVLLGNGNGGFTPAPHSPFRVGLGPFSLAVGDFNGDGKPDLAVANEGDNTVSILLGDGQGGFAPGPRSPLATGPAPVSLAVADFNADGKADLAVASGTVNSANIFFGNGDGSFTAARSVGLLGPATYILAADINLDGTPDLGIADMSGDFDVLFGAGDGTFSNSFPYLIDSPVYSVATGDFNGDGIPDFALAYLGKNQTQVWLGKAGALSFSMLGEIPVYIFNLGGIPVGSSPEFVATGDFNGDGKLDLVTANSDSNNVTMLLGDGTGGFIPAPGSPLPAGNAPFCVVVADFNGDGRADLAIVNFIDGTISILLGTQ